MLNQHKNEIFEIVVARGLSPSLFTVSEKHGEFSIEVGSSGLRFVVKLLDREGYYQVKYVDQYANKSIPYPETLWSKLARALNNYGVINWNENYSGIFDVRRLFHNWLDKYAIPIIKDSKIPNMWEQASYSGKVFYSHPPTGDEQYFFSEDEKENIRQSIDRFKTLIIAELGPTPDQIEDVTTRLDYLTKAVDRLSKFDWKGMAMSTVIGIGINLAVDTERGRLLWKLLEQAFRGTVKLLGGG